MSIDTPSPPRHDIGTVLVTGATGYIGGRLVPELLGRGYKVRAMVRAASPEHADRWPGAEIVVADALDKDSLAAAMAGTDVAFYLIHSLLLGPKQFEAADIKAAENFAEVAQAQGLRRIIYLGGLGDVRSHLSRHLRSRAQVAETLMGGAVPTTVLRAAVVVGSGSASYELMKYIVQNLPVVFVPFWIRTRCQPISISDVVGYLVGCLEAEETTGNSYDIGGPEILTYDQMLKTLADLLGKKRVFVRVPISSAGFFSYAASLLTPVPHSIARGLIEGMVNDVVCQNDTIRRIVPFQTRPFRESIVQALSREEQDRVRTRWSDAYPPAHELALKLRELDPGPGYVSSYSLSTGKPAESLYRSICSIGGEEGWFNNNWMWRLRGWVDRVLMGVGTARGRRSYSHLRVNDVVDFWRVEEMKPNEQLLLRAEMRLPGRAWLEFKVISENDDSRVLSVTAYFQPQSIFGKPYWYFFLPFHHIIFYDLIRQIEMRS